MGEWICHLHVSYCQDTSISHNLERNLHLHIIWMGYDFTSPSRHIGHVPFWQDNLEMWYDYARFESKWRQHPTWWQISFLSFFLFYKPINSNSPWTSAMCLSAVTPKPRRHFAIYQTLDVSCPLCERIEFTPLCDYHVETTKRHLRVSSVLQPSVPGA